MSDKKKIKGLAGVKKFFSEFKTFAIKGNMLDMAVGVIVGGAFSAIVTSIVVNIAMPLIGILIGVDFSKWEIVLPRLYGNAEPGVLAIGSFLNSIISFIVIAFVVFLFVRGMNKLRKKNEEAPEPEPTNEEKLLAEIRDILKAANTANVASTANTANTASTASTASTANTDLSAANSADSANTAST